jgi:predicted O-methyltransferase YrrM
LTVYSNDPEIPGWMNGQELDWLFQRACEMESIVEVGSWKGRSTRALLTGCKGPVFAVDHFLGSPTELNGAHAEAKTIDIYKIFEENVGHFSNLVVLKMDSLEAAKRFNPKSVDMVFIDGEHEARSAKMDIEAWIPVCKKILCGHDLSMGGVRTAIDEMNLKVQPEVGSIWSYLVP